MASEVSMSRSNVQSAVIPGPGSLLKEIHDAAMVCLTSQASSATQPSLQAVVVQTRGALGMLKRMTNSPVSSLDSAWESSMAATPRNTVRSVDDVACPKFNLSWSNASWAFPSPSTPSSSLADNSPITPSFVPDPPRIEAENDSSPATAQSISPKQPTSTHQNDDSQAYDNVIEAITAAVHPIDDVGLTANLAQIVRSKRAHVNKELGFPSDLLLSPAELNLQKVEHGDPPRPGTWYRLNRFEPKKSQSTEGLNGLRSHFESRVRHNRQDRQRRKSFSLGVAAHMQERSLFSDLEGSDDEEESLMVGDLDTSKARDKEVAIARFRGRRHFSFTPFSASFSVSSMPQNGVDKFPESITSKLTNGQRVEDRLKMFNHFTCMMKRMAEGGSANAASHVSSGDADFSPTTSSSEATPIASRILPVPKTTRLRLVSGAHTIPRPGKPNGGEDAFFCNSKDDTFSFAGVADGVGEWGEYDCCPRQFATELMEGSAAFARQLQFHLTKKEDEEFENTKASERALAALRAGFERASRAEDCFGSSTSIVAGLDARGENLGVANIGDSSCIVLRRSPHLFRHMTIAKRTKEQQHFFNCPYQLSRVPEKKDLPSLERRGLYALMKIISNLNHGVMSDTPDMASLHDLKVREGDLILLASDGLFDNLFDSEIIYLASLCLSPYESKLFFRDIPPAVSSAHAQRNQKAQESDDEETLIRQRKLTEAWVAGELPHPLACEPPATSPDFGIATPSLTVARALAEAAFYRSLDPRAKTPFANAARRAGCQVHPTGGKMDDITVVACWVVADD